MTTTTHTCDVNREERLAELLLGYVEAEESGRQPDRAELLCKNADFADELAEFFAGRDQIELLVAPLRHLARSGSDGLPSRAPKNIVISGLGLGILGDFRPLREVGRGGMGVVYEAEQLSLNRRVALKVLPCLAALDARQLQRFKNEAQAAACLHHPHIVPVFAVGCERNIHYFAMQFIAGDSLATVLEELRQRQKSSLSVENSGEPARRSTRESAPYDSPGSLFVDTLQAPKGTATTEHATTDRTFCRTVAEWGAQAADALEHAHQYGVVHRDVKPANLLLDGQGNLWVTDFGLAQGRDDTGLTQTGDLLGTVRYMSPEQAQGKRGAADHRTDIYSLGATLYELLTLRSVFDSTDRRAYLASLSSDEPMAPRKLNRAIPVELETIVLKALAKNPSERYSTAGELAEDLRCFLSDQPIRARRPTVWQRTARWTRRHRALMSLGLLSVVFLVIAQAINTILILRQCDEALARRREACQAVDDMYTRLGQQWLARQPQLEPLQREFLQKALTFYENLSREHSSDPELRHEAARAARRVGDIEQYLGQTGAADESYRRAITLLQQLASDFPAVPQYREELAICHNNRGNLLRRTDRLTEAEQAYRQTLALYEQLCSDRPDQPGDQVGRAAAHNNLGLVLSAFGRPTEACTQHRQAQALFASLVAQFPREAAYRHDLAGTHQNLAHLLREAERPEEAESAYRQALSLREQLAAQYPTLPLYRESLGTAHHALGMWLASVGRRREADESLARALALRERLAADFPLVPCYRQELAASHHRLGMLWLTAGRIAEAEGRYAQTRGLLTQLAADAPDVPAYRVDLAAVEDSLGNLHLTAGRPIKAEAALRTAVNLQLKLAAQYPAQPALQKDLVNSLHNLGVLLGAVGRLREAEEAHSQASALRTSLSKLFPESRDLALELWRGQNGFASLLRREGKLREAENAYRIALSQWDHMPKEWRDSMRARQEFAESQEGLGLLTAHHETDQAERACRTALATWETLSQQMPEVPYYRMRAALVLHRLGLVLLDRGQTDEAGACQKQALDLSEKLAESLVTLPECRWSLACSRNGKGQVLAASGRLREAEPEYRSAILLLERLAQDFSLPDYQGNLAASLYRLGVVLTQANRAPEAAPLFERAQSLQEKLVTACPLVPEYRRALAWDLAACPAERLRNVDRAVILAREVAVEMPDDPRAHLALGVALYRKGDWRNAAAALDQCVRLHPGCGSGLFYLALVHDRLGQEQLARRWYDQATQWSQKHLPQDGELNSLRVEAEARFNRK
jgi:serine/threonine protein kinase/Flp pilus assembly protein TadD